MILKNQTLLRIFTNLKFAISILFFIAFFSSLGSFIEQDESTSFYVTNYPSSAPIYGFITSDFIFFLGLDHLYTTWWFNFLLVILGICLISCTLTRQFPLYINSKEFVFKKKKNSYKSLPFFVKLRSFYYLKEISLVKLKKLNFYIYQKKNLIYGYKGLIGRLSPILVHFSLILILSGCSIGAFKSFKAQEILPKGEFFHIQNPIKVGFVTKFPLINTRINDFWVEYEQNKIHQFYSNLSILDDYGNEKFQQTISVNNPLKYDGMDFYQSDWNLLGIRLKQAKTKDFYEIPLFPMKKEAKTWITWVNSSTERYTIVFDQLQNIFLLYNQNGSFIGQHQLEDFILNSEKNEEFKIIDILSSTGLLIKYDPSIFVIYFGFALLMLTTVLSYIPYIQLWIVNYQKEYWIGGITNRGKIQLEIEFENLIRSIENNIELKLRK